MCELKEPVVVNDDTSEIAVPHWGITLRTLFGAALAAWETRQPGQTRNYTVTHKDTPIAVINVREHNQR